MQPKDSSFRQYIKVYADILGRRFWRWVSNMSGVVENSDFSAFVRYIFGTFRDKANIIIVLIT